MVPRALCFAAMRVHGAMPGDRAKRALDEALLAVWKQALVENAPVVKLGDKTWPVRRTAKRGLTQVDFESAGQEIRGLEQNPHTKSRWAQLARKGGRVMQFLSNGRYIAAVSDGQVTHYGR